MDAKFIFALMVFVSAFGAAGFAGVGSLLRFGKKLSKLTVFSTLVNSGFLGLAVSLLWYQSYSREDNIYGLMGLCVLAGFGGSALTDVMSTLLTGGAVKIAVTHEHAAETETEAKKGHKDA